MNAPDFGMSSGVIGPAALPSWKFLDVIDNQDFHDPSGIH